MCKNILWLLVCCTVITRLNAQPVISSFAPASAAQGDTVSISGNNFLGSGSVSFGGVPAASFTILSGTLIKAVVGTGASGQVQVTSSLGAGSLPGFTFTPTTQADFSFAPTGPYYVPATIQFTDLSAPATPVTSWLWDFYDGAVSTLANPLHTYVQWGNYMVTLTITTASDTVSVTKPLLVLPVTDLILCPGGSDSMSVAQTPGNTYEWQTGTDFTSFTSLTDNANYSGSATSKLKLISMPSSNYGRIYRCLVNGVALPERFRISFYNNWTGGVSSNWNDPANWSCGQLPDGNTNVTIYSGPVVVTANAICRTLYIAPGVSFTVAPGVVLTITN